EEELKEKKSDLERRAAYVEKSMKSIESQEKILEERRKKFSADKDRLEQDHDEALLSKVSSLGAAELERMREERRQLLQELSEEQGHLDKAKQERKTLEGDVIKLKMSREQQNKKLSEMRERVEKKLKEFEGLQDRFVKETEHSTSAVRAEGGGAGPVGTNSTTKLTTDAIRTSSYHVGLSSDEDDEFLSSPNKPKTLLRSGVSWQDVLAADDGWLEPSLPGTNKRGLKEHLAQESLTISKAKSFLQKQRRALKQR
ncbi:unnamed protein product, partial [Lymnaea stagnalis]